MARHKRAEAQQSGLSVAQALHALTLIDRAMAAYEASAPVAVAAIGGRSALQSRCQMTCVGPVARLDDPTWERMVIEYVDAGRFAWAGVRP